MIFAAFLTFGALGKEQISFVRDDSLHRCLSIKTFRILEKFDRVKAHSTVNVVNGCNRTRVKPSTISSFKMKGKTTTCFYFLVISLHKDSVLRTNTLRERRK